MTLKAKKGKWRYKENFHEKNEKKIRGEINYNRLMNISALLLVFCL